MDRTLAPCEFGGFLVESTRSGAGPVLVAVGVPKGVLGRYSKARGQPPMSHWYFETATDLLAKLARELGRMSESPADADVAFNFFVTAEHLLDARALGEQIHVLALAEAVYARWRTRLSA